MKTMRLNRATALLLLIPFAGHTMATMMVGPLSPWLSVLILPAWVLGPGIVLLWRLAPELIADRQGVYVAAAICIAIRTVFYLVSFLYIGLMIPVINALFTVLLCLGLLLMALFPGDQVTIVDWAAIKQFLKWNALVLGPMLGFVIGTVNIGGHGNFHSAYIAEVVQGILPFENPFLAGVPANFYWAQHVTNAGLALFGNIAITHVRLIDSAISLFAVGGLAWRLASSLLPQRMVLPVAYFAAFGVNAIGALTLLGRLALGDWAWSVFGTGVWYASQVRPFLPGPGFHTMAYIEVIGPASFIPTAALFLLLLNLRDCRHKSGLLHAVYGLSVGAMVLLNPLVGAATCGAIAMQQCLSAWQARQPGDSPWRAAAAGGLPARWLDYGVAALAVLPYLAPMARGQSGLVPLFDPIGNMEMILQAIPVHLILLVFAAPHLLRSPGPARELLSLSLILILMSIPLNLEWAEYKLVSLASTPLALALAYWLSGLVGERQARWVPRLVAGLAVSTVLTNAPAAFLWGFLPPHDHLQVTADGVAAVGTEFPEQSRGLAWIRKNTPSRAVIVEDNRLCDLSFVGSVGVRRSYGSSNCHFTTAGQVGEARKEVLRRLFTPGETKTALWDGIASEIADPVFVLLTREQSEKRFAPLHDEMRASRCLGERFESPGAVVFELIPGCSAPAK
ncbi:MAG: hypothetical protein Q7R40_10790 [Phaeospirillum sp.]|nr:hypothetical protein [Phaeospirillum sp.]